MERWKKTLNHHCSDEDDAEMHAVAGLLSMQWDLCR